MGNDMMFGGSNDIEATIPDEGAEIRRLAQIDAEVRERLRDMFPHPTTADVWARMEKAISESFTDSFKKGYEQ